MLTAPPAAPPPIAPGVVRQTDDLAQAVAYRIGRPVDAWAVVATLESEGWRDVDAAERFGSDDLFDLAEALFPQCVRVAEVVAPERPDEPEPAWKTAGRFSASYARGLLYALPVAGQVAALVWLGYSLWASVRLTEGGATMIAMGTIASFVATAGFVQALAHETSRLLGHGLGGQARRMAFRIVGLGGAVVLATGVGAVVATVIVPFFPLVLVAVGVTYYVLLGWLWLALALLYVEERLVPVAAATTLGIVPVWVAVSVLGWNIHLAHALGLAVAVVIAVAWGRAVLGRGATHDHGDGPEPPLPRSSTVVHTTAPYVGYGILYFAVLFADRVVSWSAAGADPLAYPVWFRTDYELGMDWALPVLFILLAALPFGVRRTTGQIHELGHVRDVTQASSIMRRTYLRNVAVLAVLGVIAPLAVWQGGVWMSQHGPELLFPIFEPGVPTYVFAVAAAGYVLFSVGLMNGLVFLATGQPGRVLGPLGWALVADVGLGFALTRGVGYEHAGWGLVAGAALFAVLTTAGVLRMLRRADFFSYVGY